MPYMQTGPDLKFPTLPAAAAATGGPPTMATPSVIDIRPATAGGRRLAAAEVPEEPAATAAFPEVTVIMVML